MTVRASANFTDDEVRAIRADTRPLLGIAIGYGASEFTIVSIKHLNSYRDVSGPSPYLNQRGRNIAHPQAKAVQTPDGRFASYGLAAKHYGLSHQTVRHRIRKCVPGWRCL